MPKRENHPDLEFLEPEAGVADVKVALFAEVFDLLGDDDDDHDDDYDDDADDDDDDDDDDDEVLDLFGGPHVPCINRFSRPTSLLLFLLLDRHRDCWQTPSVARFQRHRSCPSLNRFLLVEIQKLRSKERMTEKTNLCADNSLCDLGEGCPLLLLHPAHRADAVLQPWQEDH